jgi:hypothetical protein
MVAGARALPRAAPGWGKARLLAIGHSTRTIEELVTLLQSCGVTCVADVRTIPRSRRNPQFETEALALSLPAAGIAYAHLPRLGGLRHARKDSPNAGWHNASFRGYADHMQTGEFEEGLLELRALARAGPVALMCAEAVPWRCHRSLIADALLVCGHVACEISGATRLQPHKRSSRTLRSWLESLKAPARDNRIQTMTSASSTHATGSSTSVTLLSPMAPSEFAIARARFWKRGQCQLRNEASRGAPIEQWDLDVEDGQLGLQSRARLDRLTAVVGGDRGVAHRAQ